MASKPTVSTIGLVARQVDGKVKVFDTDTGEEIHDVGAHQARKRAELAAQEASGLGPRSLSTASDARGRSDTTNSFREPALSMESKFSGMTTKSISSIGRPGWDCRDMTKDAGMAKLNGKAAGAFIIRSSDKHFAALSMVKPGGAQFHSQIEKVDEGIRLKKSSRTCPTLVDFISHYTSPEQSDLACPLVDVFRNQAQMRTGRSESTGSRTLVL